MPVHAVAVYCGENQTVDDRDVMAAGLLGEALAKNKVTLVFGGTGSGLMAIVANAALRAGGEVIGVVPKNIPESRWLKSSGNLRIIHVDDLDERTKVMTQLSDGVVALPGGHGMMHEIEREITLKKLAGKNGGATERPIVFYDPRGFFKPYLRLIENMGRTKKNDKDRTLFTVAKDHEETLVGLGLVTPEEHEKKYQHAGAYGTYFVSREAIDDYARPASAEEKKKDYRLAAIELCAGAGSLALCFTVDMLSKHTNLLHSLSANNIGAIEALTMMASFILVGVGCETHSQTTSRPLFNPPVATTTEHIAG